MGVVRTDGQVPPQRGSELALETLHLDGGEQREVGDPGHDVLLFCFAGAGELEGEPLKEATAALLLQGEEAELVASEDGLSLVRVTLGCLLKDEHDIRITGEAAVAELVAAAGE